MKKGSVVLFCILFIFTQASAQIFKPTDITIIKNHLLNNLTEQGAIVASPSHNTPNYYYDWVRDSAITMGLIAHWYEKNELNEDKNKLLNYVAWTQKIQHQSNPNPSQNILGEPKFELDGFPYTGPWGRPQNDGPALRAIALINFANVLLKNNEHNYIHDHLYSGGLDPNTMGAIKVDLEYVAHYWRDKNFDLWEEVFGNHFFTEMVQRKALIQGAQLARVLHDPRAADYYDEQATLIAEHLNQYIDHDNQLIRASLTPHAGPQKTLELDSAVILGVLLGNVNDSVYSVNNSLIQNTVIALKNQFKTLFPINTTGACHQAEAILFGRYPGDTYDGYRTDSIGNPWFILTAAMAEYYYTQASLLPNKLEYKQRIINEVKQGDEYLKLIRCYAPDLTMKEQIHLNSGEQQGAESLTWGYVAVLRALEVREKLSQIYNY